MYRRNDPRFRRTLNEISHTLESANESAQANIFSFSHNYINPCFSGLSSCFQPCLDHCFPARDQRARRNRRSQGRAELSFDFYDDWDEDENDGLLGWENDEYDGLLGGTGGYGTNAQPGRQRAMSYGARRDANGRRKSAVLPNDGGVDPTIVPASSYFGFFGRLTGKIGGGKNLRYKPSAADLQERPGAVKKFPGMEANPLLEESEDDGIAQKKRKHGRTRRGTAGSGGTTDSFSSRGDIFPSEDEDDAVPLDDEFAMVLERRTTNSGLEDTSSGKTRSGKRPKPGSRKSTGTMSSRSTRQSYRSSRAASKSPPRTPGNGVIDTEARTVPSLTELKQEEEQARLEEEVGIARRREAAQRLALRRGLSISETDVPEVSSPSVEQKHDSALVASNETTPSEQKATPFPSFDPEIQPSHTTQQTSGIPKDETIPQTETTQDDTPASPNQDFVPAQLPRFSG